MKRRFHLVACAGLAHDPAHGAPFVDNCMLCAPRWGQVLVPVAFATHGAYCDHLATLDDAGRDAAAVERKNAERRARANKRARARSEAMRDLGLVRTRSGSWE